VLTGKERRMPYHFDRIIPRTNTHSLKWDRMALRFPTDDMLPLWVADMDFAAPPAVVRAVERRARQGIFGYTVYPWSFYQPVRDWYRRRFGWAISADELLYAPGVVFALRQAIQTFTRPGDGIIIQPPVYKPFYTSVLDNGRRLLENNLRLVDGKYGMDFAGLERLARRPRTKMLILCSPHNPGGRVWTKRELLRVGRICARHGVLVVADEIHCNLVFTGYRHVPFATVSRACRMNAVVLMAPCKTFNLAGLQLAHIVAHNPALRRALATQLHNGGVEGANIFAGIAAAEAYRHGGPWLRAVMRYIEGNYVFLRDYLAAHLPAVTVMEPEATYMVWLDFRRLGWSPEKLHRVLCFKAKVALNDGRMFSEREGAGFQRLNLACPRVILVRALRQMVTALQAELRGE